MEHRQYLLGIDVGTTGTKTLLFDSCGKLLGRSYRAYPTHTPAVGRCEQQAEHWWAAVCETVRELCIDPEIAQRVSAISLSTQGGTVVPVDDSAAALRPAIVWNDLRCKDEAADFVQELGDAAQMYEKTGWALSAGLPAMQLRWLRDHEPQTFARAARFLTVPDYISLMLTGIAAIDPSNAGINQLYDIRRGCYDSALLQFAGATEAQLPTLVRSGEVIGHLTADAAAALGLSERCVLVAGAHDQYAAALGVGAYQKGDILIGSGTCWVISALDDRPDFSSGLAQSIAATPGTWGSLWSLSSGGICLDWLRSKIGAGDDYETINAEVCKRKAAEDGLFFYPFSGRKNGQPLHRAQLLGLDLMHDRYHLARAVMEGIAFQIVWKLEDFAAKPGPDGLLLTGGASKSRVWTQMLADIADLPVRVPAVADASCVGAAILAGIGAGIYPDAAEGCRRLTAQAQTVYPDPAQSRIYQAAQQRYRAANE